MKACLLACLLALLPGRAVAKGPASGRTVDGQAPRKRISQSAAQPGREARRTLEAAIALYEKADFEAALARFNKALALFDGWKTALGHRALCRWNMGDRLGADQDALIATQLKPNNAASFTSRGLARFVVKDYQAAEADFTQALKLDPDAAEAHFGRGSVASAKGELGRALQSLGQAVRINNDFATALLVRGTVQERRKDFAAAIRDFDRVLEINPRFIWARFYRGKCRREIKDYREALADFDEFISEHPDFVEAVYLRSNVRFLAGDYAGAESDLNTVISLDPKRGLAYSNRGQARVQLGDRLGALADLKRALQLLPDKRAKIQAAIDSIEGAQPRTANAISKAGLGQGAAPQTRTQTVNVIPEDGLGDVRKDVAAPEPSEPAFVSTDEGPVRKHPARKAPTVDDDTDALPSRPAPAPKAQEPSSAPASPARGRASGLERLGEAAAAPDAAADSDVLGAGPDEAKPDPAARKKPKAKPAKAQNQAAPEWDSGKNPGERTAVQEESLLIE